MKVSKSWSEEELGAAVDAYIAMLAQQSKGQKLIKKHYYTALSERYGRTLKSYEYRMQNISYVYALQGREWVKGLAPARNVGANVLEKIEALMAIREERDFLESAAFDAEVARIASTPQAKLPRGNSTPTATQTTVTQFVRDPYVVAWALQQARGHCECCLAPAPFTREDGSAYLEVHHLQRLADGGPDTIDNVVAVCPNCHRRLHYGLDKKELSEALRKRTRA